MFEVHVFRRKEEGAENKMRNGRKKPIGLIFLLHRILESFGRSEGGRSKRRGDGRRCSREKPKEERKKQKRKKNGTVERERGEEEELRESILGGGITNKRAGTEI